MKKLFILLLIISTRFSYGQQLPTEWVATYGGNPIVFYYLADMVTDKAGNVYVYGSEADSVQSHVVLIKYTSQGSLEWMNNYDSIHDNGKLQLDKEGNIYLTCSISRGTVLGDDIIIIKHDNNGNILWRSYLLGTNFSPNRPSDIITDDSLNVYVTGIMCNSGSIPGCRTAKVDSLGNILWQASFYNPNLDECSPSALVIDSMHNVYVAGYIYDLINGGCLLIKYNISGQEIWVRQNDTNYAQGQFISLGSDGNIYVGGTEATNTQFDNFLCIKYDTDGNIIWKKVFNQIDTIPQDGQVIPVSMKLDKFDNIYFYGQYNVFLIVKLNSNGSIIWRQSYYTGNTSYQDATSMVLDSIGNIYIAGKTYDMINQIRYLTTIKYDSNGTQKWIGNFNQFIDDQCHYAIIGLDSLNNVYVSGYCWSASFPHLVTYKYGFSTGINEIEKPKDGITIYPNPASTVLNIHQSFPSPNQQLIITDLLGNEVFKEIFTGIDNSISIFTWSSGVYFYEIRSANENLRGKFIIEK